MFINFQNKQNNFKQNNASFRAASNTASQTYQRSYYPVYNWYNPYIGLKPPIHKMKPNPYAPKPEPIKTSYKDLITFASLFGIPIVTGLLITIFKAK